MLAAQINPQQNATSGNGLLRNAWQIDTLSACGPLTVMANSVIFALPPRLVSGTVAFSPELPSALHNDLEAIPTWMAGHAKVMAVYNTPFWRDRGCRGQPVASSVP